MQPLPDISMILKIAQSPAGQQLLKLLQKNGGSELSRIAAEAAAGNTDEAKQTISTLLSTPEAQKLLKQLEESL